MRTRLTRRTLLSGAASVAAAAALPARRADAQSYPDRPVRMIVPYPPGGATDTTARLVAARLESDLGQKMVVDNRGGGASMIGTQALAQAEPDGYTLGMIDSAFVINPGLFAGKLPYDSKADFAPIALLTQAPLVFVVHPSVEAKTAKEFVALAKKTPGKMTFAYPGLGTPVHLAGEQLRQIAEIDIIGVPYRGAGPSIADFIGGQVQITFATIPSILEHIKNGRARPLGLVSGKRSTILPDVPTMAEAGIPGVDAEPIYGLAAPAKTPQAIVDRLSTISTSAVRTEPLRQRLIDIGFVPIGSTPQEFRARIAADIDKWAKVVKAAGIKPPQ